MSNILPAHIVVKKECQSQTVLEPTQGVGDVEAGLDEMLVDTSDGQVKVQEFDEETDMDTTVSDDPVDPPTAADGDAMPGESCEPSQTDSIYGSESLMQFKATLKLKNYQDAILDTQKTNDTDRVNTLRFERAQLGEELDDRDKRISSQENVTPSGRYVELKTSKDLPHKKRSKRRLELPRVGHRVSIEWNPKEYYYASVVKVGTSGHMAGRHFVRYELDGKEEWIDFETEKFVIARIQNIRKSRYFSQPIASESYHECEVDEDVEMREDMEHQHKKQRKELVRIDGLAEKRLKEVSPSFWDLKSLTDSIFKLSQDDAKHEVCLRKEKFPNTCDRNIMGGMQVNVTDRMGDRLVDVKHRWIHDGILSPVETLRVHHSRTLNDVIAHMESRNGNKVHIFLESLRDGKSTRTKIENASLKKLIGDWKLTEGQMFSFQDSKRKAIKQNLRNFKAGDILDIRCSVHKLKENFLSIAHFVNAKEFLEKFFTKFGDFAIAELRIDATTAVSQLRNVFLQVKNISWWKDGELLITKCSQTENGQKDCKELLAECRGLKERGKIRDFIESKNSLYAFATKMLGAMQKERNWILGKQSSSPLGQEIGAQIFEILTSCSDIFKEFSELKTNSAHDNKRGADLVNTREEENAINARTRDEKEKQRSECLKEGHKITTFEELYKEKNRVFKTFKDLAAIRDQIQDLSRKLHTNKLDIRKVQYHLSDIKDTFELYEVKMKLAVELKTFADTMLEKVKTARQSYQDQLKTQLEKLEMQYCETLELIYVEKSLDLEKQRQKFTSLKNRKKGKELEKSQGDLLDDPEMVENAVTEIDVVNKNIHSVGIMIAATERELKELIDSEPDVPELFAKFNYEPLNKVVNRAVYEFLSQFDALSK